LMAMSLRGNAARQQCGGVAVQSWPEAPVPKAALPWSLFTFSGDTADTPGRKHLDQFLNARLWHTEPVLAGREWLAGTFSVADILMADVLQRFRERLHTGAHFALRTPFIELAGGVVVPLQHIPPAHRLRAPLLQRQPLASRVAHGTAECRHSFRPPVAVRQLRRSYQCRPHVA
jgi:glutathione S-transferase